jgi:hypothetical protein
MRNALGTFLIAATALAAPAAAAPLIYNEATNGPISDNALLGALDVGTNTVTGFRADGIFERFRVTLQDGLRLTGATIAVTNLSLADPSASVGSVNMTTSDLRFDNAEAFQQDGTYDIFAGAWDGAITITTQPTGFTFRVGNVGVSYDYTVSFTVVETPQPVPVPVPEPLGLALFGAGLLGLAAARRRAG